MNAQHLCYVTFYIECSFIRDKHLLGYTPPYVPVCHFYLKVFFRHRTQCRNSFWDVPNDNLFATNLILYRYCVAGSWGFPISLVQRNSPAKTGFSPYCFIFVVTMNHQFNHEGKLHSKLPRFTCTSTCSRMSGSIK